MPGKRENWTMRKVIGKINMRHPDNKRHFKLNYRKMNKLNKSNNSNKSYIEYLYDSPGWRLILRGILLFWKWQLIILKPGGKFLEWQIILTQRYGKVRETWLRR